MFATNSLDPHPTSGPTLPNMTGDSNRTDYLVSELAELTGVTVRTLHHYDHLGLLVPSGRTRKGYRRYNDDDLLRLQQILVCREFGMPLEKIRQMLDAPDYDRLDALIEQRARVERKIQHASDILESLNAAIRTLQGETKMSPKDLFEGFDPSEHQAEAEKRWGDTEAFKESARRTSSYEEHDWKRIQNEEKEQLNRMVNLMAEGTAPSEPAATQIAEQLRLHIDRYFYPCSRETHAKLAEMYVSDPRFAAHYEKHGTGLAAFLSASIQANLAKPVS